jgi:hypothetical protein
MRELLFGDVVVFGDGFVDELIHGFVEAVFIELLAIGFSIQGTIGLITETFEFLGEKADFGIGAAFRFLERFWFRAHIESIDLSWPNLRLTFEYRKKFRSLPHF